VFFDWLSWPLRGVWNRVTENRASIAVIGFLLLLRVGYLSWLDYNDTDFRPITWLNFVMAMDLLGRVGVLCAKYLMNFQQFGIFWPVFAISSVVLLIKGSSREKGLAAGVILAIAAYSSTFLFTGWDITVHFATAYDRLLTHVAPVAAACIVAGYQAVRSEWTAR
jgi:hypothetical protein